MMIILWLECSDNATMLEWWDHTNERRWVVKVSGKGCMYGTRSCLQKAIEMMGCVSKSRDQKRQFLGVVGSVCVVPKIKIKNYLTIQTSIENYLMLFTDEELF